MHNVAVQFSWPHTLLLPVLLALLAAPLAEAQDRSEASGSSDSLAKRDILFTSSRAADDWPGYHIWGMDPDGSDAQRLTSGADVQDNFAVWSPDGQRIAFISNRDTSHQGFGIYVMNANGSDLRPVGPRNWPLMLFPEWSPNGKRILFAAGSGLENTNLYLMDADGTDVRRVTSDSSLVRCPNWGPDGQRILYTADRGDKTQLMIRDLETGSETPVLPSGTEGQCGYWSPTGERIVFTAPVDLELRPMRERQKASDTIPEEIFAFNLRTDSLTQLTDAGASHNDPRWSPDGRKIVFASYETEGPLYEDGEPQWERFEIYIMNPDGSDVRQLTENEHFDAHPNW